MRINTNVELMALLNELTQNFRESPWVEFKENNKDPKMIGENISALSNSAALYERPFGYLIWGIKDETGKVVGTTFEYDKAKIGGQNLEIWLFRQLEPSIHFNFMEYDSQNGKVTILKIPAASNIPIKFNGKEYIRVGSNTKLLAECPEQERLLWSVFHKLPFEKQIAIENVTADQVLKLIDYPSYFDLLELDLPSDKSGILESLERDKMVEANDYGGYNILNLGAILFAKRLSDFELLERKAIRVITYYGNDKASVTSSEQIGGKGYAVGFEGLIDFVNKLLPKNEVIGQALRKDVPMYPEIAIRELIANALIHQDFFVRGAGPMIEIFSNRVEVSNPGTPLIEKDRFVDHPPISRNEFLASFMRRIGACEERGSGFDKVVTETEHYQLPAPEIDIYDNYTKVYLHAYKEFGEMDKEERIRACYLHACLMRVKRLYVTNSTLRERFKIDQKNSSQISRILRDTTKVGLIKLVDENAADKSKKYIPYWA